MSLINSAAGVGAVNIVSSPTLSRTDMIADGMNNLAKTAFNYVDHQAQSEADRIKNDLTHHRQSVGNDLRGVSPPQAQGI